MRARLVLAALALALALTAIWFGTSDREAAELPPATSAAPDTRERSDEIVLIPAPPEREPPAPHREAATAPAALEPTTPPPPNDARRRLRGRLVHSSDHRPAAGAALILLCGESATEVVTGADGRFESEPIALSGAVRAWHKGDAPDPLQTQHLEIEPETFLVVERADGELEEVELELIDPALWLEVEVVTASGAPCPAELRWTFFPPEGSGVRRTGGRSPTDAHGRARLAFPSTDPGARMILLAGQDTEPEEAMVLPSKRSPGLVSDLVAVEPPIPDASVRLVLDTGGSVRARVLDADGAPLADESLQLQDDDRLLLGSAKTDAAGVALFSSLPPGRHHVSFWRDAASVWVEEAVDVERGRTTEVELRVPAMLLAVAGRVVDENGIALPGVRIVAAREDGSTTTSTDERGAFSIGWEEREPVHVSIEPELWDDRYEPAELDVPFGTRDVLIRRRESRPTTRLTLEVLDRGTHERIPDAMVLGFVEPGRSDWSFHHASEGLVTIELKLYDDIALAIDAVGYRREVRRAVDLVRDAAPGEVCRVELEPGLERSLQILDDDDGAPLAGARVFDGARLVASADEEGRAAVDLSAWPLELRVEAAGHEDGVWSCEDWLAELGDGTLWLTRVPEDAEDREGR